LKVKGNTIQPRPQRKEGRGGGKKGRGQTVTPAKKRERREKEKRLQVVRSRKTYQKNPFLAKWEKTGSWALSPEGKGLKRKKKRGAAMVKNQEAK